MLSKLPLSFRSKVFIVLGAVVFFSIVTVLFLLQKMTRDRVQENVRSRFENTIQAFRELQKLRAEFASDQIASLTVSNPQFRTILSTATIGSQDMGFGSPLDHVSVIRDANLRLRSILPSLPIYKNSDVFLVMTAQAELLFSKADPEVFGKNLSNLSILREVSERGEAVGVMESLTDSPAGLNIFPKSRVKSIFQVVVKPVFFAGDIHGLILWGKRIDRATLEKIKEISSLEMVLFSQSGVISSTLEPAKEMEISELYASKKVSLGREDGDSINEMSLKGERFMTMEASLLPGRPPEERAFVVLKSLTEELGFLRKLQLAIFVVGGATLVATILVSFLVARGVTKPVALLADAAQRVGEGELSTVVKIHTGDELEELGGAFNEMVRGLKEREFIKSTFERYVSKTVASEIIKNPEMVRLGGAKRKLTAMFSDIGGFTSLAENLSPEEVVKHLNYYFEAMTSSILEFDGTISQFQGDAIVAYWGAPLPQDNHAALACLAVLRCQALTLKLEQYWKQNNLPPIASRFGINTGDMVVGNIGSSSRFEYTVIGDEVNLASRLEGANKAYGTQVLISESTYNEAKEEIVARELDVIRVAGKNQPVKIYELVSRKGDVDRAKLEMFDRFANGVKFYRERKWREAKECFQKILSADARDKPTQMYLNRCYEFENSPPPPDWESIYQLSMK